MKLSHKQEVVYEDIMRIMLNILLAFVLMSSLFVSNSLCADKIVESSSSDIKAESEAKKVLNEYLDHRRSKDFHHCSKLLTKSYLVEFNVFDLDYEAFLHETKITQSKIIDSKTVEFVIDAYIEIPGIISRQVETYTLINIGGLWRINDISVGDSKIVKEIGEDGKWHDVKEE